LLLRERNDALQEEVRNVSRAVGNAIRALRAGRLEPPDASLTPARRK